MKGAPAKPISGVVAQLSRDPSDASVIGTGASATSAGSIAVRRATSAARPHRVREDGAAARLDLDLHTGETQRHDDVAEEDGGVDVVAADGLQGDLGGQLGVETGIQHPRSDAQFAVLGQRPARLTHEPDRGAVGSVAAEGAQQRGVGKVHASILPRTPAFGRTPA